jgi:hypothetical protein
MTAIDPIQPPIDRETLESLTREVVARLQRMAQTEIAKSETSAVSTASHNSRTDRTAASLSDRVISAATIERLPENVGQLFVSPRSVITPAARDLARARSIAINRVTTSTQGQPAVNRPPQPTISGVVDASNPDRAAAVNRQLAKRSLPESRATIILSDTPAREVHLQCSRHRQVAVMVGSLTDVQRFSDEIDATAWVLDMKRLNLAAAINVAAQILRLETRAS